jgi:hypothetical protein
MDENLQTISVLRRGLLPLAPAPATPEVLAAVLAEFARLGVRVTNPEALNDSVLAHWERLHAALVKLRGGDKNYAPLFAGFPNNLPSFDNAALRFSIALVRLANLKLTRVASSAVDGEAFSYLEDFDDFTDEEIEEAMDFSSVGWWPASSINQTPTRSALSEAAQDVLPTDASTQWIDLTIVGVGEAGADLQVFARECALAPTSLPAAVAADLTTLILSGLASAIDLAEVRFRETRSLFLSILFAQATSPAPSIDTAVVTKQLTSGALSPDDILRLLSEIAGTGTALTSGTKFSKLSRRQRRLVMAILDSSNYLDDLWRRPGLWRALAKSLHSSEYTKAFPRAAAAINTLRSTRRNANSIRSRYEAALADGAILKAIEILNTPSAYGIALRELKRLAALATYSVERAALLELLKLATASATPTRLLDLALVIEDNGASYPRLAITKAGSVLAVPGPKDQEPLASDFVAQICETLRTAATEILGSRDSWEGESVYIDPDVAEILVPTQMRSVSPARLSVERGSRLPLGDSPVLRLFVHWVEPYSERSDLDLSCAILGDDFSFKGHVSWTNLREGDIIHSGDLTSAPAPHGSSEFIDINLNAYNPSRGRYLVPMIFRFSGPNFSELPEAFAGWMLREHVTNDVKTFDPSTVHTAFDLTGQRSTALPIVVDTLDRTIFYVDAFTSSRYGFRSTVESSENHAIGLIRALDARRAMKTTVDALMRANATARGAKIVDTKAEATITVGLSDADTYNAGRAEQILGLS